MPTRILYVSHTAARGGSNRSLSLLLRSFREETVEAHVICPPGPSEELYREARAGVITVPGVSNVVSILGSPRTGARQLTLLREAWHLRHGHLIARAVRELRPDLIHLNERGMFQAARIGWRAGIPVIMHARSMVDRQNPWIDAVSRRCIRSYVSRAIAIDRSVQASLRPYCDAKVIYNPNEIDVPRLEPRQPGADGSVRVAFLAGLMEYKGIWDLLGAARRLRGRKDILFDIYGENSRPRGFLESVPGQVCQALGLVKDVEAAARGFVWREGLGETVSLQGFVSADARVFGRTDILVFPSHLNAIGRSVFEAGIHAIPSIVTLRDRVEDIVENGVTGLIAPERNSEQLAGAIVRLADDRALRERLGHNARERYLIQFAPARVAEETLELYASVLLSRYRRGEPRAE
jgi:glycosyltransferase involved in cell wall biosynthesis